MAKHTRIAARSGWPLWRIPALWYCLPAAPLLAALLGLSLLPALFGKAPAIIVSPVEQSLCALDADGSAGIVAGGDSRALYHVIPSVIEEETGRKCVNVGQWLHLGGDPTSLVNALRGNPRILASHPTLVISVTIDAINDLGFKGTPMVTLFNWTPWDHLRVAWKRKRAYPKFVFTSMLPAIATLAENRRKGERFLCDEGSYRPARLTAFQGFEPYEGRKTAGFWHMPYEEKDYLLEGGNWRAFRAALAWLSASPARNIVILNAPIDTAWLGRSDGPVPVAMEGRFSEMLAAEVACHPGMTLYDFHRHPLADLADSLFYDQTHLNHQGALIFSRHLGNLPALQTSAPEAAGHAR